MTHLNSKAAEKKTTLTLNVTGMSCQGCVSKVRKIIQEISPEAIIEGLPKEHKLTVTSDLELTTIEASIQEAGYQSVGIFNELAQSGGDQKIDAVNTLSKERKVDSSPSYQLSIGGMTCAGCVNTVQRALLSSEGVISADVNFANHTAQVVTKGSPDALIKAVDNSGYHASLIHDAEKSEEERGERELAEYRQKCKSSALGLGLGLPLMLYGLLGGDMMVSSLTEKVVWFVVGVVTLFIMVSAGKHYFRGAWKAFTSHQANMDLLIALGTGSAWLYSMLVVLAPMSWLPDNARHLYFEASVMIIGLINLGQALELKARRKTSQALHRLLNLRPKMATRVNGGTESRINVSDIRLNDILRVRSGDKIPVDGEVIEGLSTVNESMLTGEAEPIEKSAGSLLSAGTVNGQGSLLFKATRIGSDTLLAQIITMVGKAQNSKPPISVLADKVSSIFVPSVVIIAILTALTWFNLSYFYEGVESAFSYMLVTTVSVLIIACPCALGLATPISTMIGIGKAAEYGGLIRNGDVLQRASELTVVVLDKTGTITEGKPKVVNEVLTEQAHKGFVAQIVSALEARANHPLADALLEHCQINAKAQENITLEDFESLVGLGVKGNIEGEVYYLGNERLMKEKGISLDLNMPDQQYNAATRVYFSDNIRVLAVFYIEDPIKQGVKTAISNFKEQGLKVVMLTGDNPATAASVASMVGIEDYHAQLMPDDKLNWVKKLQADGEVVGMIGDGINDAPALAQADVGFAMGAGTDVAMESADITLIHNDLKGVADVIQISTATLRNIKQNLWGAFAYNSLGIPIAAGILFPFTGWLLSPVIAGAAMALSSVTVVTNANRLRLFRISHSNFKSAKEA
ncbi:cadmium-translocating P-type ATPase [Marinomonas rhizomae]|uniref:Copper-exporting P-type ATPase n=1 Tax=Marinomonas rhizomae TaxID=491948 RepID=A0A366JCS4_9GAMM|nr:heavy metal translocating P-type ATPase [Marinomonas rhizomae]RBP84773.1 Cu+-exporting ATPase [Marinomonas rhizomae]RNF75031.1 cadmium-translocating P-type ATPase [Marinomonas rhizomae]